jgi:hypothetical protein
MNQRKKDKKEKNAKEKNIRKLLLINVDKEMQKKIKTKNLVLINSMTPIQLEKLYKVNNQPIKILISTYTNVIEKHIVEKIVDIPKNINYYQSDFKDNRKPKKEKIILRRYKHLYSAKNFVVNYDNLINDKEGKNKEYEYENKNEEVIIEHIIPFISKKKSVGEEKIKIMTNAGIKDINIFPKFKANGVVKMKSNNINNKIKKETRDNNNILLLSSSDYNSNNEESICKRGKKKKILDINYKLIYYCYTNLKRKRPLILKKSNTDTIYGLQIEEEFFKKNNNALIQKTKSIKKPFEPIRRSKTIREVKRESSKKKISSKQRKKYNNITNSKDIVKKRRIKTVAYLNPANKDYPPFHFSQNCYPNHNSHIHTIEIEHKDLKTITKSKLIPYIAKMKQSTNSIPKNAKLANTKHNNCKDNNLYIEKVRIQNIMSKAETKTSSLDNSTYIFPLERKNKYNYLLLKKKESKKNVNQKKNKFKNSDKKSKNCKKADSIKNIKYMNHNKFKHEQEEIKTKHSSIIKKHKKSLNESIKVINSLKKIVGLDNDEMYAKEKNKLANMKNRPLKFSLIDKLKSLRFKSRKNCLNYEDNNYNDEELFYFNHRVYSNVTKKNRGESVHVKKSTNILNRK